MSVRSSPRLRAIFCSGSLGKEAVFVPRLTRITSLERTLRSSNKDKPHKASDAVSSRCPREKKQVSRPKSGSKLAEDFHVRGLERKCKLRSSSSVLVRNNEELSMNVHREKCLPSVAKRGESVSSRRKNDILSFKEEKNVKGHVIVDKGKPQNGRKVMSNDQSISLSNVDSVGDTTSTRDNATSPTTGVNVKRKRGRPPKNAPSRKKAKTTTQCCDHEAKELPRKESATRLSDVVDLTCGDEAIGEEEVDAAIIVPSSYVSPDLVLQRNGFHSLAIPSEELRLESEGVLPNKDVTLDVERECMRDEGEYSETLLPSNQDFTLAQMFDLNCKQDKDYTTDNVNGDESITIPSLKRSKNINQLATVSLREQVCVPVQSQVTTTTQPLSSSMEEEFPPPSTPQQKLIRRLARQKQLEEMRVREAALLREERLLRRKGILPEPPSKVTQSSSTKKIQWKDETDLVEMFIYSPIKDDDEDTVSVHSDDASNVEPTTLM